LVIRCERCSTLYELDDALLAPEGSPVQCTRCQHVFTAVPPRAPPQAQPQAAPEPSPDPERAPVVHASAPRDGVPSGSAATSPDAAAAAARPVAPASAPPAPRPVVGPRPPVHDSRVPRGSSPAVYRPSPPAGPAAAAPARPMIRRDTLGAFESRLRWSARVKWLVPALLLALVAAAAGGWWLWSRRGDPEVDRLREEGLALLARDDRGSLETAVTRLDAALARTPRASGPAADRILAIAVRGQGIAEAAETAAARAAERSAERERLRRDASTGWEEAERGVAADEARLRTLARGLEDRARAAADEGAAGLHALEDARASGLEVARATAAVRALSGDRAAFAQALAAGQAISADDPWLAILAAGNDVKAAEPAARTRAAAVLAALVQRRPDLLRARLLLARAQAGLGKRSEALATVTGLLAVNPQHEGAQALHAALIRPPEAVAARPPSPAAPSPAPPPAGNAAAPVRKPGSQAAPLARPIPSPVPGATSSPAVPFAGAPAQETAPPAAEPAPAAPAAIPQAPAEGAPPARPAPSATPTVRPPRTTTSDADSQGSGGG
jgi:predicted Zn finger-like uncharacterized protein